MRRLKFYSRVKKRLLSGLLQTLELAVIALFLSFLSFVTLCRVQDLQGWQELGQLVDLAQGHTHEVETDTNQCGLVFVVKTRNSIKSGSWCG